MNPRSDRPVLAHARWTVVTADLFADRHRRRLDDLCTVVGPDPIGDFREVDPEVLATVQILLTGWGAPALRPSILDLLPRLELVAHAAGTVKDLVTDTVWERGIRITSAAAANALPVAEYTVAAILFSGKQVLRLQQAYREHRDLRLWSEDAPGLGNYRKRVGIVGASFIGRRVIELLGPYDLDLLLADPYVSPEEATELGVRLLDLDDLLAEADIVSLHAPSLPETHHLVDGRRLGLLRDGATLINTARGALVDHDALTAELVAGRIDAVIDVTEPEILPADSPLYELPNVLLTPHIAGSQGAETQRMADLAIDEIERFVDGAPLEFEVRRDDLGRIA
jgi:phosphoglycerate dehydrogenase-like enzyme